jgi:hypothetical protein
VPDIDITAALQLPVVDQALALITAFLEERQSQREFTMQLIGKTTNQQLIDKLIEQHVAATAVDLENKQWWQMRARTLGDVFDGDAWQRLVTLFSGIGVRIPKKPPSLEE